MLDALTTLPGGLLLATFAGLSIPLGAALSRVPTLLPGWSTEEYRHGVTAFGGGALASAICFVLVPEAADRLPAALLVALFIAGGLLFRLIDAALEKRGGAGSMFMAMLLDYLPEALALGAILMINPAAALLTAALIFLQNVPEGFSAWREMEHAHTIPTSRLWLLFALTVPLGPLCAWIGRDILAEANLMLGSILALAGGGILYLLFEDIAPEAQIKGSTRPALGAVLGFALGLAGHLAIG
ncbi:ZIP family metal transporter [Gymnodinialimonas hymeniacidonis]|uniref:ZIP family metal transporter n=1 Tax=Gymnodinialimonas hymeniacidonis TaxID=3126508 RepID=UPI0034C6761E